MDMVTVYCNFRPISYRNSDGFFDAEKLCAASGTKKKLSDYKQSRHAIEYRHALSQSLSPYGDNNDTLSALENGSWIHPRLAIDVAHWSSASLAVFVNNLIISILSAPEKLHFSQLVILSKPQLKQSILLWFNRVWPGIKIYTCREVHDGLSDIMLPVRTSQNLGLVIFLKPPGEALKGVSSAEGQSLLLLKKQEWKTLISNDYDEVCRDVSQYMQEAVFGDI
jgi:hypothetical protein